MFNPSNSEDEEYEITPDILFARIRILEEELASGKLTKESMNELLDLYTVASEFYQENNMISEFSSVLKKMKEFFQHEKIQHLLKNEKNGLRPHSKSTTNGGRMLPISTKVKTDYETDHQEKHPKGNNLNENNKGKGSVPSISLAFTNNKSNNREAFKKKLSETNKDLGVEAKDLITSFTKTSTNNNIKANELSQQQLSFRQRLQKKKTLQSSSNMVLVKPSFKDTKKNSLFSGSGSGNKLSLDLKKIGSLDNNVPNTSRNKQRKSKGRFIEEELNTDEEAERDGTPQKTHNIAKNAQVPVVELNLNLNPLVTTHIVKDSSAKPKPRNSINSKLSSFGKTGSSKKGVPHIQIPSPTHLTTSQGGNQAVIKPNSKTSNNNTTSLVKPSVPLTMKNKTTKNVFEINKVIKDPFISPPNVSSNGVFVPIPTPKSVSNKNMISAEIFYDKERNSIRISQKKLIELKSHLLNTPAKYKEKEEDFIDNFLKSNDVAKILDHEFNLFLTKILSNKLVWSAKCKEDMESLLTEFPKIIEDKVKEVNKKYDEDLSELENSLSSTNPNDINNKIYNNLVNDKKSELKELGSLAKEKVEDVFNNSVSLFNEKGLVELIEVHKTNILQSIKDKFLRSCDLNSYNSLEKFES